MPVLEKDNAMIEVNEEGFLENPDSWDVHAAEILAALEEGICCLTPDHWAVINFIRAYFREKGMAPMVRKVCQATGFQLRYIYELFPSGPAKGACKVAGLPKPDGCV